MVGNYCKILNLRNRANHPPFPSKHEKIVRILQVQNFVNYTFVAESTIHKILHLLAFAKFFLFGRRRGIINPTSSVKIQCILNMLSKFLYVVQQILFYEFLIMFCCYVDVDFQVLEDKDLDARRLKRTNFNSIINQLRVTPHAKLRLFNPLCLL